MPLNIYNYYIALYRRLRHLLILPALLCTAERVSAAVPKAAFVSYTQRGVVSPGSTRVNGVYPDPYHGLNNAHEKNLIPDISQTGPQYEGFEDINKMPVVDLQAKVKQASRKSRNSYAVTVTNPSKNPEYRVFRHYRAGADKICG